MRLAHFYYTPCLIHLNATRRCSTRGLTTIQWVVGHIIGILLSTKIHRRGKRTWAATLWLLHKNIIIIYTTRIKCGAGWIMMMKMKMMVWWLLLAGRLSRAKRRWRWQSGVVRSSNSQHSAAGERTCVLEATTTTTTQSWGGEKKSWVEVLSGGVHIIYSLTTWPLWRRRGGGCGFVLLWTLA